MASYLRNYNLMKSLLKNGTDINAKNSPGYTALHVASYSEDYDLMKFLLENGADINTKSSHGYTALHVATILNQHELIEFLLLNGVDITAKDSKEKTAFYHANYFAELNRNVCKKHGVDVNVEDSKVQHTCKADYFRDLETIKLLENYKASITNEEKEAIRKETIIYSEDSNVSVINEEVIMSSEKNNGYFSHESQIDSIGYCNAPSADFYLFGVCSESNLSQ